MPEFFYEDILNKHKNKPAIVLGHGPSMSPLIPHIGKLNEKFLTISCNEWFLFFNDPIDYWVVANSVFTMNKNVNNFNRFPNTKLIYADVADSSFDKRIADGLKNDYMLYTERDVDNRIPIYIKLQEYCNYEINYRSYGTVALHMLAFAVLMGCNPIYITGVDLDYNKGYALERKSRNPDSFEKDKYIIINSFDIIKKSANNIGVQIYGIGTQPSHGVFGDPINILDLI